MCIRDRLNSRPDTINREQLLFGINQGAIYEDIRISHAQAISELDLDGYAVGGLAVGESHEEMYRILDEVVPHLPQNKPTYLMGVGTPANILEGVERGIDFFDCVYPDVYKRQPLTLASTAPMSMIPEVSAHYAKRDIARANEKIDRATWISMLISIPAAVGLAVLSGPITRLIFPVTNGVGAQLLLLGVVTIILNGNSNISNGVLQGIGKQMCIRDRRCVGRCARIPKCPLSC